jgi:hypothetical protein
MNPLLNKLTYFRFCRWRFDTELEEHAFVFLLHDLLKVHWILDIEFLFEFVMLSVQYNWNSFHFLDYFGGKFCSVGDFSFLLFNCSDGVELSTPKETVVHDTPTLKQKGFIMNLNSNSQKRKKKKRRKK